MAKTFCLLFLGPKNIELKVFSVFDRFWSSLINPINCEKKILNQGRKDDINRISLLIPKIHLRFFFCRIKVSISHRLGKDRIVP